MSSANYTNIVLPKWVLLLKPLLTVDVIKALKHEDRSLILPRSFNSIKSYTERKQNKTKKTNKQTNKYTKQERFAVNNNSTDSLLYYYFFVLSPTLPLASNAITARPLPLPANWICSSVIGVSGCTDPPGCLRHVLTACGFCWIPRSTHLQLL